MKRWNEIVIEERLLPKNDIFRDAKYLVRLMPPNLKVVSNSLTMYSFVMNNGVDDLIKWIEKCGYTYKSSSDGVVVLTKKNNKNENEVIRFYPNDGATRWRIEVSKI